MYWTLGTNATAYASLTVNGVPQFQNANPGGGVPQGTALTAAWFNDMQGENINALLLAGIAPAESTPTQVAQAYRRMFGGNTALINAATEVLTLTADQMGFVEVSGSAALDITLPSPVNQNVTPLSIIWNNSSATLTLTTPAAQFDGPGGSGSTTMTIPAGGMVFLRSDTANYIVFAQGISASQFSQRAHYTVSQSGSPISIGATNTVYTVESLAVTMPTASKTGGFRVLARILGRGTATAEAVRQNFIGSVNDGTTSFLGADWLCYVPDSGDGWGTADTILIPTVYSPGESVTFTHKIETQGGDLAFTITGSSMELYIEEA